MKKNINEKDYFLTKKRELYLKYTSKEIKAMIDPQKPDTFIWLLEELDFPWLPTIWNMKFSHYTEYNVYKYMSYMRLGHWKQYTFKDSEKLEDQLWILRKGVIK